MELSSRDLHPDVVIVGAGTAGLGAAAALAERGLRVTVLERRPLDEAGARWVNELPRAAFGDAGLEEPAGAELRSPERPFHLVLGEGAWRVRLVEHGVIAVDMRRLVERLRGLALSRGARVLGGVEVGAWDGLALETSVGRVRPLWVVDASGLGGASLLGVPSRAPEDLCTAAQRVHRVADVAGARAFFASHGVEEGETLAFAGIAGGYSVLSVRLEGDEVSLLTGTIPALGHRSGLRLLEDFVSRERWIGAEVFGGARAIPLGRPLRELARGSVAALGDAGTQVFGAHGSGIAAGLIAGRLLAETFARGGDPWAYCHAWQRRHGGTFAAFDEVRRFLAGSSSGELLALARSGLLSEPMLLAGLRQALPRALPDRPLSAVRSLLLQEGLGRRVVRLGARVAALLALYRRFPRQRAGLADFLRWEQRLSLQEGEASPVATEAA